jgi:hypothetical protein
MSLAESFFKVRVSFELPLGVENSSTIDSSRCFGKHSKADYLAIEIDGCAEAARRYQRGAAFVRCKYWIRKSKDSEKESAIKRADLRRLKTNPHPMFPLSGIY